MVVIFGYSHRRLYMYCIATLLKLLVKQSGIEMNEKK